MGQALPMEAAQLGDVDHLCGISCCEFVHGTPAVDLHSDQGEIELIGNFLVE